MIKYLEKDNFDKEVKSGRMSKEALTEFLR